MTFGLPETGFKMDCTDCIPPISHQCASASRVLDLFVIVVKAEFILYN